MNRLLAATPLLLLLPAAADLPIRPGKWQSTVTILDVRMPSAPPGMAARMRGRPQVFTNCVTPAQAANGPRTLLQATNGKCRYTSFSAAGGRINTVMSCDFGQGGMTVRSTGTYTATSMDVIGSSSTSGKMAMQMKSRTAARKRMLNDKT
jgi:hypothetical protein